MPYLPHRNIQPVPTVELFVKGGTAPLLPAPVLSTPGSDTLVWTYSPDPNDFALENSVDGVTGWTAFDGVGGNERIYFGVTTGFFYRIYAENNLAQRISGFSNAVLVP